MSAMTTSTSGLGDATATLAAGASSHTRRPRKWSAIRAPLLIGRAILDCAYLVRSPHSRRIKIRILLEYLRLTITLILRADASRPGADRLLHYRVSHFGYESLQFLFREIFVRNDYGFDT